LDKERRWLDFSAGGGNNGGRNMTPREDEFLHGNDVEKEGGKL